MLNFISCLNLIFISYILLTFTCCLMSVAKKLDIKIDEYDPILILKNARKNRKEEKNAKKD